MSKYTDLNVAANLFKIVGVFIFAISILYAVSTESIFFMIAGLIGFVWWYAIGGALLVLIDIAKSVRASAVVAIEQEERSKAKPSSNGKPLGLQRVNRKKRREA